jgi:signal transduction histidine kinase/CheY-like chemotaxis protein
MPLSVRNQDPVNYTTAASAARCIELESVNAKLRLINDALMNRVERDMDRQGNSFSLFQAATVLESKVHERTTALQQAMHTLERTNRQLVESNAAAQAATRSKSAFLAAMSHELRTPMNGVVGMIEYLNSTRLDDKQRKSLDTIRHSALNLLYLLNDILDFSKIEAGQLMLESAPFDLRRAMHHVLQLFRPQLDSKNLQLQIDWPDDLPTAVIGDTTRFSQILTNLVANAIKFTGTGSILITARMVGEQPDTLNYQFHVHDTGIGIKKETIPLLFNPFMQADSSTTRKYGGTGLGLVIVRRLCELMNGECGVSSELGKGSSFWFSITVPRDPDPPAATQELPMLPAPPDAAAATAPRRRVLLVEDNAINQDVAAALLEVLNCDCHIAANGRLALAAVASGRPFDLILMDCQMPEMDGYEASRQIRALPAALQNRLPIVALTANAMSGDRELCLAAGMNDFLSKPFQLSQLRGVLAKWCPTEASDSATVLASDLSVSTDTSQFESQQLDPQQLEILRGLRGGTLLPELLRTYRDQARRQINAIQTALQSGDTAAAASTAHSLKSASFSIGASRVGKLCAELEAGARLAPAAVSLPIASELAARYDALLPELTRLLQS